LILVTVEVDKAKAVVRLKAKSKKAERVLGFYVEVQNVEKNTANVKCCAQIESRRGIGKIKSM
jgi:hypothetical protein